MGEQYISKSALTEAVYLSMRDNPHKDGKIRLNHNNEHMHFVHMIYHTPGADVMPVIHAKWVKDKYTHQYRCSHCKRVQPYDACDCGDHNHPIYDYWDCNFCPECGARMDLEKQEEHTGDVKD